MTSSLAKNKRTKKYLLIVFGVFVVGAFFFFLVEIFIRRDIQIYEMEERVERKEITIDFETLEKAKSMVPFEKINPLPRVETRGRGNPFISYEREIPEDYTDYSDVFEEDMPLF